MTLYLLAFIFLLVAIIYSSVGFGGGSSYIAMLLLANIPQEEVRFIALFCNILVVSIACVRYLLKGYYEWSSILPIIVVSIPLAYIGGNIITSPEVYKVFAGFTLLIAALLMIIYNKNREYGIHLPPLILSIIGGIIGFISGFIGIGGGVFLSPILHLSKWKNAITISAITSLFILVNSIAGIIGLLNNTITVDYNHVLVLGLSVIIGGWIGSNVSLHILNEKGIRLFTALLIGIVGIRLLFFN